VLGFKNRRSRSTAPVQLSGAIEAPSGHDRLPLYRGLRGIDLRQHGFGSWNVVALPARRSERDLSLS